MADDDNRTALRSGQDVERFLAGKPREWAEILAARTALRVLPLVAPMFAAESRQSRKLKHADILLTLLRGIISPWLTTLMPSYGLRVGAARAAQAARAADAAADAAAADAPDDAYAAAAYAAVRAAMSAAAGTDDAAYAAARATADASSAAAARAADARAAYASAAATRFTVFEAFSRDALGLADKQQPNLLRASPLWSKGAALPVVADAWGELAAALLKVDGADEWQLVWIDWYEALRDGHAPWGLPREAGEQIIVEAMLWPHEEWGRGAKHINLRIAGLITKARHRHALDSVEQSSSGLRFDATDIDLRLRRVADAADLDVAQEPRIQDRHRSVVAKARALSLLIRVDNQLGWDGIAAISSEVTSLLDRPIDEMAVQLPRIYDLTISLASFYEQDLSAEKDPHGSIDKLPIDCRRVLQDFIRSVAPWLRSFPSVEKDDNEAGAFLARPELFSPAAKIFDEAAKVGLLTADDLFVIRALIAAAQRGEFQGGKAANRVFWGARNLVVVVASLISFNLGMIGNEAAPRSVVAKKGSELYIRSERAIAEVLETAPLDLRLAIADLMERLKSGDDEPDIAPQPPKIAVDLRRERRDD